MTKEGSLKPSKIALKTFEVGKTIKGTLQGIAGTVRKITTGNEALLKKSEKSFGAANKAAERARRRNKSR